MDFRIFAVLAVLAGTYAGPVKPNLNTRLLGQTSCAKQCTAKSKFSYQEGQVYVFSYEAETKTGIHGASDEQAGLRIQTTAEIEVLSKCELALKLRNTAVYGSDPNIENRFIQDTQTGEFQQELEQYPLRFSFQDGIVEELCPTLEESPWSLNIKRGILSAFQNSMDSFDREQNLVEVDVIGKCRTDYKIAQKGWRTQTLKKSKDMISCTDRHGYESSIQSALYNVPADIRSLPLLKSTHECDQEVSIRDGHVQSVECHEMHIFRPFSKGNSGAMTEVTQKLTFVSKRAGGSTRMAEIPRRASIVFEHTMGEKQETMDKKAAEDKLKELCTSTPSGIQSSTPRLFSELVYLMKKLDANALDDLYKEVKKATFCPSNPERAKKFYLDAIPMVGTGASIRQITQFILNKDVSGKFADAWLTSIVFIQHPTKDMLSELAKLLDTTDASRVALSLSTLTASYCKSHPQCDSEAEVIAVLDKFQTFLGMDCSGADKTMTMLTLRAIGNIEQSQRFVPTLENCFSNHQNSMEIRIAAVEAHRKMSCGADRNNLMALYRSEREDSEIRIMAYLQVMKCPSANTIQQVKDTLQNEEVNQVGSFVWTHITNLMETSSPLKQSLKTILEDHDLPKKFDLDVRKFSRNLDWSYFSEALNAGGSLESNLVWSTESFIPRSAMANLTIDIFGRSVNLLEVGGRMEGLDYLLESYFGPSGSLHSGTISPAEKDHSKLKSRKFNKIDNAFDKKVQELKAAMYVRVFGNEIIYQQLNPQSNKPADKGFNLLEMFMELKKNHNISYTKSSMFLDSTIVVPTVVGLPLNLTVNGTVSVDLVARGKMDLSSPAKVVLIEGEMSPSGAVEFSTTMSVDAFVTKSGMKMTSTLHTSSGFSGKVEIKEKDDITVQFNVPQQRSDILNVQSSFFAIQKDQERSQKMLAKKEIKKNFCTGYTLAKLTGLELCGEMSYVNASSLPHAPYFPLTGPVNLVYKLLKRDTHTGYKFEVKKINNRKMVNFKIFYDTPGSSVERATGFELDINKRDKTMRLELVSPWKKARFNGNLVDNKNLNKISGIATIDDTREYRLNAELHIQDRKNVVKYKPNVMIMYPDRDPISLSGSMEYQKQKSFTSSLVLEGIQKHPMKLDAMMKYTDKVKGASFKFTYEKTKTYATEATFRTDIKKARYLIRPKIDIKTPQKQLALFEGSLDYKVGKSVKIDVNLAKVFKDDIKVKGNFMWERKGLRARYKGRVNFRGPKCSAKMRVNVDKRARMISTTLKSDYNFAKYIKNAKDSFTFNSKLINKSTKRYKNINLNTNFKCARFADYNNQLLLKMDHRFNKLADLDVVFDYGKNYLDKGLNKKKIAVQASSKYNLKKDMANLQYNMSMKYPAMNFQAMVTGKHYHTKKNMKSAFSVLYDNKKTLDFGIKFSDETKKFPKYSGELTTKFNGRSIEVQALATKKGDEYNTKWTVSHQKGKKSVIIGSLKFPSNTSVEGTSNIRIYEQPPVSLVLSGDMSLKSPKVMLEATAGQDKYKVMAEVEYTAYKYGLVRSEVTIPTRSVKVEVEGGEKRGKYVGKIDAAWNASIDPDQRVLVEVSSRFVDMKDFEGYFITQIPGRQISANVRHNLRNSLDSSVEFAWSPGKKVSGFVQYTNDRRRYKGETMASIGFSSPFKNFEEYKLVVGHSYNQKSYESMLSITYGKMKTVSLTAITQIPVSLADIDIELLMKSPYSRVGNPRVKLSHSLSKNNLKHYATISVTWGNKQFINFETNGEMQPYHRYNRNLIRNVGFTSSFAGYESVIVNMTHVDNLEKFESRATINHNQVIYKYKVNMNHNFNNWEMDHSGTFEISSPYDSLSMLWNLKNSKKDLRSNVEILWGNGQRFTAQLNGDITDTPNRRYTSRFEMNIPSNSLRRVDAVFEHEDKPGFIRTEGSITADRKNVGRVKVDYQRQLGSANFALGVTSMYMNDFKVILNGKHAIMPMTGLVEIEWAPSQKITVDARYSLIDKTLDSKLVLRTPFRPVNNVVFIATHKLNGFSWNAETSIENAPYPKIVLGTTYRLDSTEKALRVYLTTPYPQFSNLDTGIRLTSNANKLDASADFKLIPYVGDIKATAYWKEGRRSIGKVSLTTPFRQYPGLQGEVSSTQSNVGRISSLWLEYLPGQKIEVDGDHTMIGKTFNGKFNVKTPFTHPFKVEYRQTGDLNAFSNHADIKYNFNQSIVMDTTFGLQPKIYGTYSLSSPIKGYEEVKFAFSHEGEQWKNFRTQVEYGTDGNKIMVETMLNVEKDYQGKLMLRTPFPHMRVRQIAFSHEGNPFSFKTHGELINNDKALEGDAVFSHTMQDTMGSFTVKTPLTDARFVQVAFNKQGTINNFRSHAESTWNDRKYETDVIFSHDRTLTSGTVSAKSPIQGWEETVISFNRDGSLDNFKAGGEIRYADRKMEGSLTHSVKRDDVSTTATLVTPYTENMLFKLMHNTRSKGFTNNVEFSMGTANSLKSHVFYRNRGDNLKLESDVTVVAAGETNTAKFSTEHKGDITEFTTKAEGEFNSDKASASVQFRGDKWENADVAVKVELPVKDYEVLEFVLKNQKSGLTHKMDLDVQYATGRKITSKTSLTVDLPSIDTMVEMTTPFQGYSAVDVTFTNKARRDEYMTELKSLVEKKPYYTVSSSINTRTYFGEILTVKGDKTVFQMKYSEDQGRRQFISLVNYNKTMTVSVGTGCQVNLPLIDCDLKFSTPYSENLELKLKNTQTGSTHDSEFSGTYGAKTILATSSVTENFPNLSGKFKVITPFTEDLSLTLQHSETQKEVTSEVDGQYGFSSLNGKSIISRDLLTINTGLTFTSPSSEDFTVSLINTNNGLQYTTEATGALGTKAMQFRSVNNLDFPNIESEVTFTSPFTEDWTSRLTNKVSDKDFSLEVTGSYGSESFQTKTAVSVDLPDLSTEFQVRTPYTEDLSIEFSNAKRRQNYVTKASGSFGNKVSTLTSNVKVNLPDVSVLMKVTNSHPHTDYSNIGLELKHEGEWKDMKCMVSLTTDKHAPVLGETRFRFAGPWDMEASAKLNSGIKGVENIGISMSNTKKSAAFVSHLDVTLDSARQIVYDSSYELNQKSNTDMKSSLLVAILTPFQEFSSAKYMASYEKTSYTSRSNEYVEYNNQAYLDYSQRTSLDPTAEFYSMEFETKAPRPMEYTFYIRPNWMEGRASVNWEKRDVNSNFNIDYKVNGVHDERQIRGDLVVNAIHPKLSIKVEKNMYYVAPHLMSKFMLTINDGKQQVMGYDLHLDRHRRYLKVVTPERSVEGQHTFDTSTNEVQAYWDADGDRNKMVGVKVLEGDAAQIDKFVELRLPEFGKVYSLHTKINQKLGRKILDLTTEFSYSPEHRKNIVFFTEVEDNSRGSTSNTSWSVGISQPFTNLDLTLSGHVGEDADKKTMGLGVDYLTDSRQKKNLLLLGEIDALKKQINLNVFGPKKSLGLQGHIESEVPYKVVISSVVDGVQSDGVEATLDKQRKMVLLKIRYDRATPDSAIYIMGKYPTTRDIEAQVYHIASSTQVTDTLLNVQLRSTRILHTKLHWRPEMFADLLEYLSQTLQTYGTDMNDMFTEVGMDIAKELAEKDAAISKELVNELRPFLDSLTSQMKSLQQQMKVFRQKLVEMKQNNTLYLKDINDGFDNTVQEFIVQFGKATRQMKKTYRDMSAKINDLSNEIKTYPFQQKYTELVQTMSQKMEDCRQKAVSMMRQEVAAITDKMRVKIQELKQKIQRLAEEARTIASEKLDAILQHPDVVEMKQQMKDLINRIPFASDIDINHYMNKVHTAIKSGLKGVNLNKHYNDAVTKVQTIVNKHYDDLSKDQQYQNFKKLMNEIYEELLLQYQYLKLRDSVKGMVEGMVQDTTRFITEDIAQLKIIGWHRSRIIEFDPVNGNIEADIYIPTAMETLERFPKLPIKKVQKIVKDVKEIIDSLIPDKNFSPWDIYYRYKPRSLNPVDWVPPFKAHAIIAGGRHFVTFDGKKFDFSGSCSFVLTRDLVNQNFTVMVNFDKRGENMESLLVFAEGQNIEISTGFAVKINERPHELPYSVHKLTLERVGNWIKLDTGRGLVITGDAINNHYVIEVSGWYFGKLAGLLGTYNNEQYDEMTAANARLEKDFDEFTKSWEVSKSCRPKGNQASDIVVDKSDVKYQKCAPLLEMNNSEFRPCFRQVDPSMYLSMCINTDNVCAASSAYIAACQKAGVTLSRPSQCVACSAPNDEIFLGGEKIKVSPASDDYKVLNSADTVLVVEEKSCNSRISKELGDLVYEIENDLIKKGMTNNRYGLVGYSKSGPHSHTMEGQLLNDPTKFNMGIESMKFTSHFTDTLEAIQHSVNYPFRSGVARNIILLQCGRCSDTKSIMYHTLERLLESRDIKLHILRDQELKIGNKSPKQKILGVDNERKYVLSNRKDTVLDALLTPADTCTHLALKTNGSIFDSSSMIASKIRDKKYFVNTVSSRISATSQAHECQVCKCMSDETGAAQSVCRKCYSEFSDYMPAWFHMMKHPAAIKQELADNFQDFMAAGKGFAVLKS